MLIRTRAQNPVRIPFDVTDMVSRWSDSFNCIFYVRKIITMIRTLVSVYGARMWHDEGKLNLPNSANWLQKADNHAALVSPALCICSAYATA
jgi:hypothetical protein